MSERAFVQRREPRADVSLSASYKWAHAGDRRTGRVLGAGGLRFVSEDDDFGSDGTEVIVALPPPRAGREMAVPHAALRRRASGSRFGIGQAARGAPSDAR